jgi:hypothetical protein
VTPWRIGDIVALVPREGSGNGSGDGILWRVIKVKNLKPWNGLPSAALRVEPCWCATGNTSLRAKSIHNNEVYQRIDFVRLGELRVQLDELCREALKREAGIAEG